VLGAIGEHAGYAMRHGTILLARAPERFPVTFNDCGEHALGFLVLLIKSWRKLGGRFAELKIGGNRVHRYAGDLANGGKGEILIWHAAAD
jgi:formylmethanofuran dehydrogenase subunit C